MQPAASRKSDKPGPDPLALLLVSGDPADAALCQQALWEGGWPARLELARGALEFHACLAAKSFHAIVAAETLAGWSGLEAMELAQRLARQTPFILLTVSAPDRPVLDSLRQAGGDYVSRNELVRLPLALEWALGRRALDEQRLDLEAQLRQSQKMEAVGRLAAGLAHDFNNVLTVIQGHVGLLQAQVNPPPEMDEALREIGRATERAGKLINQLLSFTRDQEARLESLDLNEVLTDLSMLLHRALGEDVAVQFTCAPRLPRVRADRGAIDQVILKLAVQAREAMPAGGQLMITTTVRQIDSSYVDNHPGARLGLFVCLSAIDTGDGTEAPAGSSAGTGKSGAGESSELGWAAVAAIAKRHLGWVETQNRGGQGSTFAIFFPAESAEGSSEKRSLRPIPGGTETILVVEDEPPVLWITRNILEHHGYQILEAGSGVEALAVWHQRQHEIALLLTDLVMPVGVSGLELAEHFRRQKPGLRVIYTSGYSPASAPAGVELVEGVNFLKKPYDAERLARAVRQRLDS